MSCWLIWAEVQDIKSATGYKFSHFPICCIFHLTIFYLLYNCKLYNCGWLVPQSYYLMNHCCNHCFLKFLHAELVLLSASHKGKQMLLDQSITFCAFSIVQSQIFRNLLDQEYITALRALILSWILFDILYWLGQGNHIYWHVLQPVIHHMKNFHLASCSQL